MLGENQNEQLYGRKKQTLGDLEQESYLGMNKGRGSSSKAKTHQKLI